MDFPEEPAPSPLGALLGQGHWPQLRLRGDARASRSGQLTQAVKSGDCIASRIGRDRFSRALRIPEQSWVQASAEPSDRGLTTVPQIHGAFSMEQEGGDQVSLMPKPILFGGGGTVRGTRIYQKPLKRDHAHSSSLSPARFTSTRIINFFVCGSAARRQCSYCTKLKV